MPLEVLKRGAADAAQIRAAQVHQRLALERIELQIDLEPALALGQPRDEIRLARDAQPVGVDHHVADRPRPHRIEDGEQIGMQRRLAAGDLHQVGLAFAGDQGIEHPLDGRERKLLARAPARNSAKQTGQVRLQCSLISISARQECCSWSGQSPQS